MPSVKIERLQKLILHDVQEIVAHGLRDPRIKLGTVTKVKLADDMRHAKVFVSCLGTDADKRTFLRGLESARGRIQSTVARHLQTRVTPKLAFEYDEGIERSIRMSSLIDQAIAEDDAARAARGEPPHSRAAEAEEE